MTAILAIDLGRTVGWGLVGRQPMPIWGSAMVVKQWSPLGASLLVLEDRLHKLITRLKPDMLATATQFFDVRNAATTNLIPLYTQFGILNMMAETMRLPIMMVEESMARSAFLGRGNTPRGSKAKKAAVIRACEERGWMVTDDHQADALCVATYAQARANPARAYETTPLFNAAATMRARRSGGVSRETKGL